MTDSLKNKQSKKPVLIIIAGPNGSGKISVTNKILKHEWIDMIVDISTQTISQKINLVIGILVVQLSKQQNYQKKCVMIV
jgi:predicted ABC-type ATPase